MSTMIGTAPIPKQISPQQSVSSFPQMRQAFMRLEEENSGDSKLYSINKINTITLANFNLVSFILSTK
jgi:hypothetical protein